MNKRAAKAIKIGTGVMVGLATGIALMASANASDGALRTSADLDKPAQPATSKSVVVEVVPDPVEVPAAPASAAPMSAPEDESKQVPSLTLSEVPAAPGEVGEPTDSAPESGSATCTTVYDMNAEGYRSKGTVILPDANGVIVPPRCE